MKITRARLRQIIQEEIQKLNEIPTHIKLAAMRRGVPHMGSAPGPRRSVDHDGDADDPDELRDIADDIDLASFSPRMREMYNSFREKYDTYIGVQEFKAAYNEAGRYSSRALQDDVARELGLDTHV